MFTKNWKICLIIVVLGGSIFRLWQFGKIPVLFDGDEMDLGYNAYALLNRGTDEYGVKLPLYFSSLGDFQYPAYVYLSTLWVKAFGLTQFSTRLTSAIAGIIGIALVFWIGSQLSRQIKFGLISAAIMATSSWSIFFSRKAVEGNLGLMMVLLMAALILRFCKKKSFADFILVFLIGILGLYTYQATRIFLIGGSVFLFFSSLAYKQKTVAIFSILLTIVGLLTFISPDSRARGREISLASPANINTIQRDIDLEIHSAGLAHIPPVFVRMYDNKMFFLGRQFVNKIVDNFSTSFILTRGDDRPRYSLRNSGFITFVEAALIIVGLIHLGNLSSRMKWGLLAWTILAAIPSSLTSENPHAIRFILVLPVLIFLAAYGALHVKNRFVWVALVVGFGFNLGYVAYQNVIQRTFNQPWEPEVEMLKLPELVLRHQAKYRAVLVPGDPYIFFLFSRRIDPSYFTANSDISPNRFSWDRVNRYENIIFKAPGKCPTTGKLHVLYFCPGYVIPANAKIVDFVRFADGVPAYVLIEFFSSKSNIKFDIPDRFIRTPNVDTFIGDDGVIPDSYPTYWP